MTTSEQLEMIKRRIEEVYEGLETTRSHKRRQDLRRALEKLNRKKRQLERDLKAGK